MRITNQMMVNSSISNIQGNKSQLNDLSTQLSTQKKINKPSDDPIIAIRALRLRSSLDEVTQYLGKNIPDASSWLSVTHDALDESNKIIQDLYNYCVQGSTDSYSESERNTLAESLNKLVEAYYEQGNVDYAGRYVFTGHATDKPLTYQSDETAKDVDYTITQNFTREDLSNKTAYTNAYTNDDIINLNVKTDANGNIITPNITDVHRIQLAYDEINGKTFSMSMGDNNSANITIADDGSVTVTKNDDGTANVTGIVNANGETIDSLDDGSGNPVSITFTADSNYIPGDDEIAINSQLGEVLLGENVYKSVYADNAFSVTYEKSNFIKGDIDPTMYFNCVDNNTGIEYNKQSEDIEYIINFSQKIKVNTEADEAFNIYLGRNVDDLVNAVQNVLDINDQISKIESMQKEGQYSDEASQKKLSDIMEGLTKQRDFAKSKMKDAFEAGIGQMQGYQEQVSNAKADVGNRQIRLDLTKTRLTEQKTNFTDLKSQNEDIDLEEIVVTYTSAQLVYQAALSAASKVVQQTLLDFLG